MNRRILFSLTMIAFAGAVVAGATGAFFSDTETSSGNTFTAGAIDLTIDSTATYNGNAWATSTWTMKNLVPTSDKFFNFSDVKPGDSGTNVISLHVSNNDAYACLDITNLHNDGNGLTEPEDEVDADADGAGEGELAQNLDFFAWADIDGDGVFEPASSEIKLFTQASGIGQASDVLNGKTYTIADSLTVPMASNTTQYIGLQWCAGDMTVDLGTGTTTCSGLLMGNESQTDSVTADISFRVEQSRNNSSFVCAPQN